MPPREVVLQQALALNAADRAYVVDQLEQSLPLETFVDQEIAQAWSQEIDRRIAAFDRGDIQAIDFDTAVDHVRQALQERRSRRTK